MFFLIFYWKFENNYGIKFKISITNALLTIVEQILKTQGRACNKTAQHYGKFDDDITIKS